MNKVLLLRHGITQHNLDKITVPSDGNVPLCELGIESALANVDDTIDEITMNGTKSFVIMHSPALRTRQTMQMYAKRAHNVIEVPELIEVNFGDYTGKPDDVLINGFTMGDYRNELINGRIDFRYPNGESIEEITERAHKVIDMFEMLRQQTPVLVIGHSRIFRHIELEYRGRKFGERYFEGMFGSEYPHASVYDIDSNYSEY